MNSFKAAIRGHRIIFGILMLALLALAVREIFPALANGVNSTITSGQTVFGTVTGTTVDNYTFYEPANRPFVVTLSESGTHVAAYAPYLNIFIGSHFPCSGGNSYLVRCAVDSLISTGGTYTAQSQRTSGTTGGSYSNYKTGPGSEYNQIQKWGDRGFRVPDGLNGGAGFNDGGDADGGERA